LYSASGAAVVAVAVRRVLDARVADFRAAADFLVAADFVVVADFLVAAFLAPDVRAPAFFRAGAVVRFRAVDFLAGLMLTLRVRGS
jgi:hypothetical protein